MEKTAKVIILGGTGIIGRELSSVLLKRGCDVFAISRHSDESSSSGVQYITADVRDTVALKSKLANYSFDVVIDLLSFNEAQLTDMLGVVKDKCSQYIFVSSATVYEGGVSESGITEETPQIESGWDYPLQKIKAEDTLKRVCIEFGLKYTIVRPYITYSEQRISFGGWEGFGIVEAIRNERPIVIGNELADSVTTLTHSYDLAVGIAGLVMNDRAMDEDFHITSDESMTWREVFKTTAQILDKPLHVAGVPIDKVRQDFPELIGKIRDRCAGRSFDNTKLKKAVPGFSCKYSVEDGYREIINQHLSSGLSRVHNPLQQGRIDRLVAEYGTSEDGKKIRKYRHSLLSQGPKAYIKYAIGYNKPLYKVARFAVSVKNKFKNIQNNYS